jgi:hypothetical protein
MIAGLMVKIPLANRGINLKNQKSKIIYLCEDGFRVYLDTGYFHEIKDLIFIKNQIKDTLIFAKCIQKHGSLFNALTISIK